MTLRVVGNADVTVDATTPQYAGSSSAGRVVLAIINEDATISLRVGGFTSVGTARGLQVLPQSTLFIDALTPRGEAQASADFYVLAESGTPKFSTVEVFEESR